MGIALRAIIPYSYFPFELNPDFQLHNKLDYFTPDRFMSMPFSYAVIENNYKFDAF